MESVNQGALELSVLQLGGDFLTFLPFWMCLLGKGAYRDISHILKHTISNMQVSKISAQKKGEGGGGGGGGGVMTATNMCSNFCGFRCSPASLNLCHYTK